MEEKVSKFFFLTIFPLSLTPSKCNLSPGTILLTFSSKTSKKVPGNMNFFQKKFLRQFIDLKSQKGCILAGKTFFQSKQNFKKKIILWPPLQVSVSLTLHYSMGNSYFGSI